MATLTPRRRKRVKEVTIPEAGTPERDAWDERQAKLQAQHAESVERERAEQLKAHKALLERRRYQRRRDAQGGTLFGDEDIPPEPTPPKSRPIVPPRGPTTDGSNKVIADGEVPVKKDRRKAKTKVEAARDRARRGET